MRVLKEPNENMEIPRITRTCTGLGLEKKGCGRLLEIAFTDVNRGTYASYGDIESYYYFTCPICGAKTEVSYLSLPSEFRALIK